MALCIYLLYLFHLHCVSPHYDLQNGHRREQFWEIVPDIWPQCRRKVYLREFPVPCLDDVDDAGVGVEDDERWEVEGPHGRVDHVPGILIVLALRLVITMSVRV